MLTKNIELNDDTVLNGIKYKNQDDNTRNIDLTQLEQTVLYCFFYNAKKNSPNDELTQEELKVFIDVCSKFFVYFSINSIVYWDLLIFYCKI